MDIDAVKGVVLDEADEMLNMGFKEDLNFILDETPETRNTYLFSATIPGKWSVLPAITCILPRRLLPERRIREPIRCGMSIIW